MNSIELKGMELPLKRRSGGFTLVELLIVVAIVALLVAMALPAYQQFIRKSHRGEAQQLMMNYANLQEIWRANNSTYATAANLALPTADRYDLYVRGDTNDTCGNSAPTATVYRVVACAKSGSDQANDKQSGVSCTPLSLSQANAKSPALCWN